jgi:hypothetical protein
MPMPDRTTLPSPRRWATACALLAAISSSVISTFAVSTSAWADSAPDKAKKSGDPFLIGNRSDKPDGSTALTVGRRLPTEWETKVGMDFGLKAPLTTSPTPEAYLDGWAQQDRSSGAGWASIAVPATPFGLDKAAIEARIDPTQDQGRLATTLSRSMPIGDDAKVTLQQGYAWTETLANPAGATLVAPGGTSAPSVSPPTQMLTSESQLSLNLLSTDTTFAAGAKLSSTEDKWLRTLSAEQKLFGGPFSVTGAISERPTGETDKSVKAGFKHAW